LPERMDSGYEEDIACNPFFLSLKENFPLIYEKVEKESLFLCVPQIAIAADIEVTMEVLETHIIKQVSENSYVTLNGKSIRAEDNIIKVKKGLRKLFAFNQIPFLVFK